MTDDGRPRSKVALLLGLALAALIVAFLVWFIASNTETREPGSLYGAVAGHPVQSS